MSACANSHDEHLDTLSKTISYDDLSRREVRSLVFHLLYAMDAFEYDSSLNAIVDNFNRGFELSIPLNSEVFKIAEEVIENRNTLDQEIKPLLHNWRFDRVGVCTKLILRFALWELINTKTSANIVLNEAIELSKCFAEKDAYKFINGILDEAVKKMGREAEIPATVEDDEVTLTSAQDLEEKE
jgi:N utilization substance protein B